MFEDTLSEYHRVSTALASRHDLTEAISVRISSTESKWVVIRL